MNIQLVFTYKDMRIKIKRVSPTFLAPVGSTSTKVNTIALIGWTCLGVRLAILGSLYLFKCVKLNVGKIKMMKL